jgi:hypothetical protein
MRDPPQSLRRSPGVSTKCKPQKHRADRRGVFYVWSIAVVKALTVCSGSPENAYISSESS